MTTTRYRAGAPYHPGTSMPTNVTGECPHLHKTPQAAQACIDRLDRSIKRGHGQTAYCDRMVMLVGAGGIHRIWRDADGG